MKHFAKAAAAGAISLSLLAGVAAQAQPGPANPDPKAVQAGSYGVEPFHTRVEFSVSHLGFTHYYGDFSGLSGSLELDPHHPSASKLDVDIPVSSVSTTNAKLDDELKGDEWFDAAKYPSIHFTATKITRLGPSTALITGDLTLHGVTRPVTLHASFNGAGVNPLDKAYTVGFDATTTIHRSQFGVTKYVPLVGDDVSLRISAAFEKKPG